MKKIFRLSHFLVIISIIGLQKDLFPQNIGIGTTTPIAKLHIKGSADTSQLVIDANSTQSNIRPLIKLRNSSGTELLRIHSDDTSNIFIGRNAGRVNIATISGGTYNTFIGGSAGRSNTTGIYNTANGESALSQNTTGNANTACGGDALIFNTTGINNSAFGLSALAYNNTGNYNTASGITALYSNTTGSYNTATGMEALFYNTAGDFNTANGADALLYNTTGNYNTANGFHSLYSNTTGTSNTAIGTNALYSNNTGAFNTATGVSALYNTTSSQFNVAFGYKAGFSRDNGYNNVFVGAYADANANGFFNTVAIGAGALAYQSNEGTIGNSSTIEIFGWVNWTDISDGRIKRNIRDNVPGLAFINKLIPVTYNLDLDAADKIIKKLPAKDKDEKIIPAAQFEIDSRKQKEQILYSGFIAQDVEKAAKELNYDFSGVDAAKNDKDLYGLRYAEFVVPLVKAVQELSKQNEELLKRIEKLESFITSKK